MNFNMPHGGRFKAPPKPVEGILGDTKRAIKNATDEVTRPFRRKKNKGSKEWWSYGRAFFVSMGAILIYGLITNIALLCNGIYTLDPAAHNLAFIISAIASGAAMAYACFHYVDQQGVYTSPVDAILAWSHGRPDTSFMHTVSRVLGLLAGAFICAGVTFLIFQDKARVQLAATVVNPLNIPTNGNAFTAFCLETIGTVVLAIATYTLDAQHRRAADRAVIKGLLIIGLRLAIFQYTSASFNVFLSLAMNATTNQWSTFAPSTYYIYWVSAVTALVVSWVIIRLQKYFHDFFALHFREETDATDALKKTVDDMRTAATEGTNTGFDVIGN